jgi:hypothetical protein
MTRGEQTDSSFASAAAAHRAALSAFIAAAERIPSVEWNASSQPDKWTPAQIAEHLRLSYTTVRAELAGSGGFRVRTSWWRQRLMRLLYLPRILREGRMPRGVPATREIRPSGGPYVQRDLLDALRAEGESLLSHLEALQAERGVTITHPYLGKLHLLEALGLSTAHIHHHRKQLPGEAAG